MKSIVVLCTGNSCRSQMTAAWFRHLAGNNLIVHSAGVRPSKALHSKAVEMMAEIGIDVCAMGESPKHYNTWASPEKHDLAIFVCPNAEATCTDWQSFAKEKASWPTEDPGDYEDSPESKDAKFREVRDGIKTKVLAWLHEQQFSKKKD